MFNHFIYFIHILVLFIFLHKQPRTRRQSVTSKDSKDSRRGSVTSHNSRGSTKVSPKQQVSGTDKSAKPPKERKTSNSRERKPSQERKNSKTRKGSLSKDRGSDSVTSKDSRASTKDSSPPRASQQSKTGQEAVSFLPVS